MPRPRSKRGTKAWKPLMLDHDTALNPEYRHGQIGLPSQATQSGEMSDMVVFAETFESMVLAEPVTSYMLDVHDTRAAVIFFLKPEIQTSLIVDYMSIPSGVAGIANSALQIPAGPLHGQRLVYIGLQSHAFAAIMWCSQETNWSHIATYHQEDDQVRISISPDDWNASTIKMLASHSSQVAGLLRIYRIGARRPVPDDKWVIEHLYTDPFAMVMEYQERYPPALLTTAIPQSNHPTATSDYQPAPLTPLPTTRHPVVYETPIEQLQHTEQSPSEESSIRTNMHENAPLVNYGMSSFTGDQQYHASSVSAQYWPSAIYTPSGTECYQQPYALQTQDLYPVSYPYSQVSGTSFQTPDLFTTPYVAPPQQYASDRGPGYTTNTADPHLTRSMMRDTVMKMSQQAKERNKNLTEYRTVLHDPFRSDTKTPLRPTAPAYVMPPSQPVHTSVIERPQPRQIQPTRECEHLSIARLESEPDTGWRSRPAETIRLYRPSATSRYTPQNFNGPFFTDDMFSTFGAIGQELKNANQSHDQIVDNWWWSGKKFSRQEDFHHGMIAIKDRDTARANKTGDTSDIGEDRPAFDMGRLLVPVMENLAEYIEGPMHKRRDHFSRWVRAPEWCCDRSANGNNSFFDIEEWGHPPARIGRDPRYQDTPNKLKFGGFNSFPTRHGMSDRRHVFGRDIF